MTTINKNANNVYKPKVLRLKYDTEHTTFSTLRNDFTIELYDSIETQLLELLACRNPSLSKDEILSLNMIQQHLKIHGETLHTYGVWVHYPWKRQLVHILDEEEFIEVRTNRNKYKINQNEQDLLRTKKIGIAGLSVGRAVATTIALERIAGEIRLADMDNLELSNLNRINAPLYEMGMNKTISVAREISEVDPFIKVKCFVDGLIEDNMDSFFQEEGKLDLFVEECDDIAVKIKSRLKCKELGIPVVMETNDNCVIDVERFDLEPDREIFHGALSGVNLEQVLKAKSIADKIDAFSLLLDFSLLSGDMKYSMNEINKTITSWPQLYTDVNYGASVLSVLIKSILSNRSRGSFRKSYSLNKALNLDNKMASK
jgi:molybdopterin/thiamine biosynthesis adenylyltransferase